MQKKTAKALIKFLKKLKQNNINLPFEEEALVFEKLNDKQLLSKKEINGETFFIIVPNNHESLIVPLFCPLCSFAMKTKEDIISYKKNMLCEHCHSKWGHKKRLLKNKNFKSSNDWVEYIDNRTTLLSQINIK